MITVAEKMFSDRGDEMETGSRNDCFIFFLQRSQLSYLPSIILLCTQYNFTRARVLAKRNSARAQVFLRKKHGINTAIILFDQCPRYLYYFSSQMNAMY